MPTIGEIIAILNDKFALVKTTQALILGSEILVYSDNELDQPTKDKAGISSIRIPKGKLKVIMLQKDNLYLVSTISKKSADATTENQNLAKMLTLYNSIFGSVETEDLSDKSVSDYSAVLDNKQALKINVNILAQVGDKIAFGSNPNTANKPAETK